MGIVEVGKRKKWDFLAYGALSERSYPGTASSVAYVDAVDWEEEESSDRQYWVFYPCFPHVTVPFAGETGQGDDDGWTETRWVLYS